MNLSHIENRINKLESERQFCLYYVNDVLNNVLPSIQNLCKEVYKERMSNKIAYYLGDNKCREETIYFDVDKPKYTEEEILKIFISMINKEEYKQFDTIFHKIFTNRQGFLGYLEYNITYTSLYYKKKLIDIDFLLRKVNEYYDEEIKKEKVKENRTIKNYNKKLKYNNNI